MAQRKEPPIPILRVKKGDSLKTIYAKAKRAFSAADLAKYAEDEPMIPAEQIVAELEAIDRQVTSEIRARGSSGGRKR
jgi:hypothetical protein